MMLRDQRSSDRRAQQIAAFVDAVRMKTRQEVILQKFLTSVDGNVGRRSVPLGSFADLVEVFDLLPNVEQVADDLVALLGQPVKNDGRVQPAGIREYNFALVRHRFASNCKSLCFVK